MIKLSTEANRGSVSSEHLESPRLSRGSELHQDTLENLSPIEKQIRTNFEEKRAENLESLKKINADSEKLLEFGVDLLSNQRGDFPNHPEAYAHLKTAYDTLSDSAHPDAD